MDMHDIERELRMKEQRVAFWETFHALPDADDLTVRPSYFGEVGA